ncbi:MAG: EAL domain-containing protein [Oleiphilaceae bacterium]|nr:EAL domain-containing protein [Oleiphilaceae bacterium]
MSQYEPLQILHDRVDLLYRNAVSGIAITVLASSGLALGLNTGFAQQNKRLWWISITLVCVLRYVDVFRWHRKIKAGIPCKPLDLYLFRCGAIVTAMLWSFYCVYFFKYASIFELLGSIVIVSAMAGGACTVLSGDRLLAITYTQILLVPYSVLLVFSEQAEHHLLGILGLAFAFVMFTTARKAADFTHESVVLRHQHEHLLENMQGEVNKRTQQVVELSQHDALTKLLNRSAFLAEAERYVQNNKKAQFSVFFIDLDGFKPVNDNFGHKAGDEILQALAQRLQANFAANTLICRWGGDEFIVLSKLISDTDISAIAHRIKEVVHRPFELNDSKVEMDASIGVALYPNHSKNLSELISYADVSMYDNKHTHRDEYVLFNNTLAEQVRREFMLSSAIRHAVRKEQLSLKYQPIIDTPTGKMYAVEALLRWNLNGETIPPDVFIPLAEKNGAIRELGYWVLEQAMLAQKQLHVSGQKLKMCINVSIAQFEEPEFVDNIEQLLRKHQTQAANIHLELTESVFSTNQPKLLSAIKALQQLGFHISIDDFGTGYSSLSVIQDLRVNVIKIDRSFISKLASSGNAIVKAVMLMARELNYKVVAEGIEEDYQAEQLKALGIDFQQGFLYSKPIDYHELVQQLPAAAGE